MLEAIHFTPWTDTPKSFRSCLRSLPRAEFEKMSPRRPADFKEVRSRWTRIPSSSANAGRK